MCFLNQLDSGRIKVDFGLKPVCSVTDFCPAAQSENWPRGCVCGWTWQQECLQVWVGHSRAKIRVWLHLWDLLPLPHCWGCNLGESNSVERGECLFRLGEEDYLLILRLSSQTWVIISLTGWRCPEVCGRGGTSNYPAQNSLRAQTRDPGNTC